MDSINSMSPKGSFVPMPKITFLIDQPRNLKCDICLLDMEFGAPVARGTERPVGTPAMLACGHMACLRCLDKWVADKGTCPFCRLKLEYELCSHMMKAKPVDRESVHLLPKTLPEGGRLPDQCGHCTLKTSQKVAERLDAALAQPFREARERYAKTKSRKDLALLRGFKDVMDHAQNEVLRRKPQATWMWDW
ncbi:hypothetical protein P8C59_000610 [Phyllachora maydis]|uniref:RING-type domain-containing protein n=1 Tax=Phyllachora maydis TaxID=1825666 RepID=A0AAD9MBD6_9PEZI|nr:hypothetical protein P8C59_000610 [Phyllachora maydis]